MERLTDTLLDYIWAVRSIHASETMMRMWWGVNNHDALSRGWPSNNRRRAKEAYAALTEEDKQILRERQEAGWVI